MADSKVTSIRLDWSEQALIDALRQHYLHHHKGEPRPESLTASGMLRFALAELVKREKPTNPEWAGCAEFEDWKYASKWEDITRKREEAFKAALKRGGMTEAMRVLAEFEEDAPAT